MVFRPTKKPHWYEILLNRICPPRGHFLTLNVKDGTHPQDRPGQSPRLTDEAWDPRKRDRVSDSTDTGDLHPEPSSLGLHAEPHSATPANSSPNDHPFPGEYWQVLWIINCVFTPELTVQPQLTGVFLLGCALKMCWPAGATITYTTISDNNWSF